MARPVEAPEAAVPPPVQLQVLECECWRIIGASLCGRDHVTRGIERQDAFAAAVVSGVALAVVCDGAGSAKYAAAGAARFSQAVLDALKEEVTRSGAGGFTFERFRDLIIQGVEAARAAIEQAGLSLPEHHATLLALAACTEASFIAHVGDGLAGVAPSAEWGKAALSLPENGEYANETFFVTEDNWTERLRCTRHAPLQPAGVAVILTDGAMSFVIGPDQQGLEPDFMAPVSRHLFGTAGMPAAEALAATLGSAGACRISADDKTLVWIGCTAA